MMELSPKIMDSIWWVFTVPLLTAQSNQTQFLLITVLITFLITIIITLLTNTFSTGGLAWKNNRAQYGRIKIPGSYGLPIFGSLFNLSYGLPHHTLSALASKLNARQLMAFSLGSTPAVVASDPVIAREILTSPHFADRPVKLSAKTLMFHRAIGFAPNGTYWRLLRRVASAHLFAPKRIAAHEGIRQSECASLLNGIFNEQFVNGRVCLRKHLQNASINNITGIVFGKRYDFNESMQCSEEVVELRELIREGFELLGAFNWSDYLPWLNYFYDPLNVRERCLRLAPRVKTFVQKIIDEHKSKRDRAVSDNSDFVDVLLSLDGTDKIDEEDMIAILWEMIFRGTDTTALLTEWVMAKLVLNPNNQSKLRQEIDRVVGDKNVISDADVTKLPYLQAVIKETLRVHPPGPLLSWARLSTSDVQLSNGMVVPKNTTAMVNMWAITHDPKIWENPSVFKPERFLISEGGTDVDVKGGDLRLAPFGAGRRVCPGKNLGLVTVSLWVAKLVQNFVWVQDATNPINLSEVLKLSCEMKYPLHAVAIPRNICA